MPDTIFMEAWAFSLAMATDDDHRAFCQQQLDKAREHYLRDCEHKIPAPPGDTFGPKVVFTADAGDARCGAGRSWNG